jgi:uncharacterized protein YacL
MRKLNNTAILRTKIIHLENQRNIELDELKIAFHDTKEDFKPINLMKNSLTRSIKKQTVTDAISGILIGLATGYLVKKTLFKKSDNILMNTIAMFIQSIVTSEAVKHSDEISSKGSDFLSTIYKTSIDLFHKYKEFKSEPSDNNPIVLKEATSYQM